MKCSECSSDLRPVVVFDIDGTLGRYHGSLGDFIVDYFDLGEVMRGAGDNWNGEGNFEDLFEITQEQYRQAKLAWRQGGMKRTLPPYLDAISLPGRMKADGCDIWYATTRPWERLDNVDPDTKFWIRRLGLPIDGIVYGEDKYERLVNDHVDPERIIGIVEDLPEQYDAADDLGLPIMQVARNHNSGPSGKRERRGTMGQIEQWLNRNLQDWKDEYDG